MHTHQKVWVKLIDHLMVALRDYRPWMQINLLSYDAANSDHPVASQQCLCCLTQGSI